MQQIVLDILNVFEANGNTDQVFSDARGLFLLIVQAAVGRRCGMDNGRLRITQIRCQ